MVTLTVVPYSEIQPLSSVGRIRKLLNIAKKDRIVLLQGRLRSEEEAELIKATMEEINKDFKGIELAVINPTEKTDSNLDRWKNELAGLLLGDRTGLTIIGPASVVKAIRQDPNKIELLTRKSRVKKASTKKKASRRR